MSRGESPKMCHDKLGKRRLTESKLGTGLTLRTCQSPKIMAFTYRLTLSSGEDSRALKLRSLAQDTFAFVRSFPPRCFRECMPACQYKYRHHSVGQKSHEWPFTTMAPNCFSSQHINLDSGFLGKLFKAFLCFNDQKSFAFQFFADYMIYFREKLHLKTNITYFKED